MIPLGGLWSISCGQYLDPTLGKFCPIYGPHLSTELETLCHISGHDTVLYLDHFSLANI